MHSSAMPCGRLSLPLIRAGRVSSSITANMTGISITSEAFMPAMVEFCGMLKGASVTDTPLTSTRLNTFAPMTLPSDSAP